MTSALLYVANVAFSTPFADTRYWFPVFLLAIVASAALAQKVFASSGCRRWARIAFSLLITLSLVGYPAASGFPPRVRGPHTGYILYLKHWYRPAPHFAATRAFRRAYDAKAPLVLSPINPAYLNSILSPLTTAIPDQPLHDFRFSKRFRFEEPQIRSALRYAVASGRRVFHLAPAGANAAPVPLPTPPAGFTWRRLTSDPLQGMTHELVRAATGATGA